ncbi:response regulator receiver modulated serine phosphatase [[Leptolyngbya] sp. PCC 7376]|uniref:PP2C family protein-serine/threonine phosphatase n=1 Tax=[Leptolyngbya] sp. PCC 7376 TaxID=111781 RepID=UPI00029F3E02|nr:SpoIIE family protein phosphatase [[Leptolyngbya] sp. PCC 7376]AFY38219.1 response regulator receiver modulated serine phosphatase [[Leptolyngbya] sp. PCC 7376]
MIQILVIDDDPAIRTLLKRTLVRQGYDIHEADNGTTGLEMAIALQPNLVICDWMMPGLSGIDVCRKIKTHPQLTTSTFCILLTALDSTEDKVMGLDAGADDFLCKPIEIVELQARVRAVLRIQQLAQDLHHQKQKLEAEFTEAAQYVQSLLPPPLNRARIKIETCFIPSSQLGGDGFDYFWLDNQRLAFYLLDVSGHGLKAALPSIAVLNLMRSRNGHQGVDYGKPKDVLKYLSTNCKFIEQQEQYFTMWYGVFDIDERVLTYASAGHPPAILLGDRPEDYPQLLRTKGFPVGMFEPEDSIYQEQQQYIPFNSCLYVISDGVYENSRSPDAHKSWEDFLELLIESTSHSTSKLDHLAAMLGDRLHHDDLEDDFSMMKLLL